MTDIIFDENSLINPFETPSMEDMTGEPGNYHERSDHHHVANLTGDHETGQPDPYYTSAVKPKEEVYDFESGFSFEDVDNHIEQLMLGINDNPADTKELDEATNTLALLEANQQAIAEVGVISKDEVVALESLFPGIITDKIPLTGFTTMHSAAGFDVSQEALTERVREIINRIIKAIKESINSLLTRLGITTDENLPVNGFSKMLMADYEKLLADAASVADVYGNDEILKGLMRKDDPIALKSSTYKDYIAKSVEATYKEHFADNFYVWYKLIVKKPEYYTHLVKLLGALEKSVSSTNTLLAKFSKTNPSEWSSINDDDFYKEVFEIAGAYHKVKTYSPIGALQDYRLNFREDYRTFSNADGIRSFHDACNFRDPFSNVPGIYNKLRKDVAMLNSELSRLESKVINGNDEKPHTGSLYILQKRIGIINELNVTVKMHHDVYKAYYRKMNMIILRNRNAVKATEMILKTRKNVRVAAS